MWEIGFTLTSKRSSEMVLKLPELMHENQDWKIYRAHILDSAAAEGVVSHLSGAAPKPVDSRELEAWNVSNAVAKYIILEVITDSLLARLVHHKLAHTLFSHLAAIFGDHDPIAIEPPAERSHQDEPLQEDSHPKSDDTDSARTTDIVEGKDVEGPITAAENPREPPKAPDGLSWPDRNQEKEQSGREHTAHDTDRDNDHSSLTSELKTTEIHNEKPSGTTPAGIPNIPSTNSTSIYPKDLGELPNVPDGTSRGDNQEMAKSRRQWQCTMHEVNRNNGTASPAPNLADRMSKITTGDGPIPSSQTQPKNTVKHQCMSTRYIPWPNGCANANAQRSNGLPKPSKSSPRWHRPPFEGETHGHAISGSAQCTNANTKCSDGHLTPKVHLPRWHRPPLEGERHVHAANSNAHNSSGHPMPQKLVDTLNELKTLVTVSFKAEDPGSSETITHICLGDVSWRANNTNSPRD